MRKKIISIAVVVLVVALLIAIRFLQLMPYPKGEFNWIEAPNQRHRAYIGIFTDMKFFSGERRIYQLKVELGLADGKRMSIFEQDVLHTDAREKVDLNHLENNVLWAPDSGYVIFHVARDDIRVDVPF
ncbi:MAG: hypothetical protein O3B24_07790 [Verrucomicrobia bacterium]|nr:hypothetical protein [Verrucomicrobiota bacterium]